MLRNFFSENRAVYKIMWRNLVEPDRPQMTVKYSANKMRFAYRHTLIIFNTYSFMTVKLIRRTRLKITLYVQCLSYVRSIMNALYCVVH